MAKFLTLTSSVVITDGGSEVVNREHSVQQSEIGEYVEMSFRIATGGSKFVAIEGTDITGITDPLVIGLTKIWGVQVMVDQQVGIKVDGAVDAVSHAPGQPIVIPATCDDIALENEGAQTANVKLIVWGEK